MPGHVRRLALLVVALAFLLAGCGGDGGEAEQVAPETAAPEPVEEAPPAEPPAPAEPQEEPAEQEDAPADPEDAPAEAAPGQGPRPQEPAFARLPGVTTAQAAGSIGAEDLGLWRQAVPGIQDIRIPASSDGVPQGALWLAPGGGGPRPLLVVVHSWSSGYLQAASIPFARWADRQGWAMIAPDFRGPFDRPAATGSDTAVQDVVDAIDWAIARGGVDEERVYVIGFSGGGMMSLLMAGRHPGRIAAAVSWVPVYDLADWYAYNRANRPDAHYVRNILDSCGGDPTASENARASCRHRSPSAHLDAAREARVPVYIGHGLADDVVPPDHAIRSFNGLAAPSDRLGGDALQAARRNQLPAGLRGSVDAVTFFRAAEGDPTVVFARRSGPVTLVLFNGTHDLVYHPGLEWLTRIAAAR